MGGNNMEKQLKKVTLWTTIPMAVFLVITLALVPASIDDWKADTGIAPTMIGLIISICYVAIVFISAIVLNIRGNKEIGTRIIRLNGFNLIAFLVVFFIVFIIGNAVVEGAAR
jgi:hypothetical protein